MMANSPHLERRPSFSQAFGLRFQAKRAGWSNRHERCSFDEQALAALTMFHLAGSSGSVGEC